MNKFIKSSLFTLGTLLLVSTSATTHARYIDKALEKRLVTICEAIKSGNKRVLKRAIKAAHVNERIIMKGLKCNGMDPITFAMANGASKNANYLAKRTGKNIVHIASSKS